MQKELNFLVKNINSYIFLIFLIIIFEFLRIYLDFIGLFLNFEKKKNSWTRPAPPTRPTRRVTAKPSKMDPSRENSLTRPAKTRRPVQTCPDPIQPRF
jgi:hypothetical protein